MPEPILPPKIEKGLRPNIDRMSFKERQELMRNLGQLSERLTRELGVTEDGLETISGHRIYVESNAKGEWVINGLEFFGVDVMEWFGPDQSLPRRATREEAIRRIYDLAGEKGYTIVEPTPTSQT